MSASVTRSLECTLTWQPSTDPGQALLEALTPKGADRRVFVDRVVELCERVRK